MEFRDCPYCGTEGVLLTSDGACPNCKRDLLGAISQKSADNDESSQCQDIPIVFNGIYRFGILKRCRSSVAGIFYFGGMLTAIGLGGLVLGLVDKDAADRTWSCWGGAGSLLVGICLFSLGIGIYLKRKAAAHGCKEVDAVMIDEGGISCGKYHCQIKDGIISSLHGTAIRSYLLDTPYFLDLHFGTRSDDLELNGVGIREPGKAHSFYYIMRTNGWLGDPDYEFCLFKDNEILQDFKAVLSGSVKGAQTSCLRVLDQLGECIQCFPRLPLKVQLALPAPREPGAQFIKLFGGVGAVLDLMDRQEAIKNFKKVLPSLKIGPLLIDTARRYDWEIVAE